MVGITHKSNSLRTAVVEAVVKLSSQDTIDAVINKKVPKGDPFEFSRASGLLAIKKTSDVIPDCHPLPIEYAHITHRIEGLNIIIRVEVQAIYRTGVEVEAMHGAAITALTIYDMLKPIDQSIEIANIRLIEKKGGKSGLKRQWEDQNFQAAVIVCSDTVSRGIGEDKSGKSIIGKLESMGIRISDYEIIADDFELIQSKARELVKKGVSLVIFTGGTGVSPKDHTPDAIEPLLERKIPGIMETARHFGQDRGPYAMLSRGIAGFIGQTLVLTFPGSQRGAEESMDALFPQVLHVFNMARGEGHGGK